MVPGRFILNLTASIIRRRLGLRNGKVMASWCGSTTVELADAIIETGIPAVDVRGAFPDLGLPFIGVDNRPIAKLAFDHLQDCGLRHFAFCGTPRGENPNQDRRCDYFVEQVEQAGYRCNVFLGEQKSGRSSDWEKQQEQIARWLSGLPKPVGIMTCHDDRGHQVLDACRRAELEMPR